jgi:hypothetical protein
MTATAVLGIFAKQPIPGQVKTRLCPPLTPELAARLYQCSLQETAHLAELGDWCTVLFYQGDRRFFDRNFPDLPLAEQTGNDLGERLAQAFASRFASGAQQVVIIGSDSPDLPAAIIRQAFAGLNDHDAVLAPAGDGGYVLIGLRHPAPGLFRNIPWSTGEVLTATRKRMLDMQLSCLELPGWHDVDDVASLRQLVRRSPDSVTAQLAIQLLDETVPGQPSIRTTR